MSSGWSALGCFRSWGRACRHRGGNLREERRLAHVQDARQEIEAHAANNPEQTLLHHLLTGVVLVLHDVADAESGGDQPGEPPAGQGETRDVVDFSSQANRLLATDSSTQNPTIGVPRATAVASALPAHMCSSFMNP